MSNRQKTDISKLDAIGIVGMNSRTRIRSSRRHSADVRWQRTAVEPPPRLYHGTLEQHFGTVQIKGYERRHGRLIYMHENRESAEKDGGRRRDTVILTIKSEEMFKDGHTFYLSENGVWLTDAVPVKYINF